MGSQNTIGSSCRIAALDSSDEAERCMGQVRRPSYFEAQKQAGVIEHCSLQEGAQAVVERFGIR
jgi:hypothetical protein